MINQSDLRSKMVGRFWLTLRQFEVAYLASQGWTNKQIAVALSITEKTVKFHMGDVLRKCEINSRVDLVHIVHNLSKEAK